MGWIRMESDARCVQKGRPIDETRVDRGRFYPTACRTVGSCSCLRFKDYVRVVMITYERGKVTTVDLVMNKCY